MKKDEKTLHVFSNAFWIYGKGMSGGEKLTLEVIKRWGKYSDGWNLRFYSPIKFYNIVNAECTVDMDYVATSNSEKEVDNIILGYMKRTARALLKIPYFTSNNIFYSTSDFLPDVIPAVVGKIFNKNSEWKIIVHHIYESYKTRPGNKLTNFISCTQQKCSLFMAKIFADSIIIESPFVFEYMKDKKFNLKKIHYAECGVNYQDIQEAMCKNNDDIETYDGIFLGRLNGSKGIFELPLIWSNVVEKIPNAKLAIIGNGSEENKEKLTMLIKKYNLENNIYMLGYLENEETYQHLAKAKVFVFPSHEEGWGISISEGMAAGLPVVAYNLPIYDFVFEEGMIKIPLKKYKKFSNAIIQLLTKEEERIQLAKKAKEYVRRYDWEEVAKKEYEILLK